MPEPVEASPAPARAPTMRDVAAAAGVSIALVSHAFGRPARVAPATRERILQTAAAIGYAGPNPAARALRIGSARRLGVVAVDGVGALLQDQGAVLAMRGLARMCDRAGLTLALAPRFAEPLDAVIGLRVSPVPPPGVPTVVIDPSDGSARGVRPDYVIGAAELAEYLGGVGHRSVVVVSFPGAEARLEVIAGALRQAGTVRVLVAAGSSYGHGDLAARAIQAAAPRASAIVALSDPLARGLVDAMRWSGRRVPEDVSIASVDGLPGSDLAGLTSVLVPYEPLGELAGALVLDEHLTAPALPTTLVIRETTGPAPG